MLNLQTIFSALADNVFSAWIPLWLSDIHNLEFKKMGFYASLPLLGGALGGALGGWLNDKMIAQTGSLRWSRTVVGATGKGIAGVLLLTSLLWYDEPQSFCVMLFFVKFFSDWSLVTTWGCVTDIGGRASATVFAYNNSVAGIGSIVGSALYGYESEYISWVLVFVTAAAAYLVCALTWFLINCEIPVIATESNQDEP
jgi:ACS family glucarate transporter-like MFS transporter